MNESEVVARARDGDPDAWALLMRHHQQGVFRLAYLLLGDAEEADDVTQETFIQAHRHLARFDDARPMRPWLLGIATHRARNRRRGIGRYVDAVRRWFQAEATLERDPRQEVLQAWEVETLWQAVRRLRQSDQEVIYLRYFLDLSEREAAQVLVVAQGTVKSRTHRALARLRTLVERDFPALAEGRGDDQARV